MDPYSVTVIIPTYNRAHFLKSVSLPSVMRQTRAPVECIIVDDGSTDGTTEVAKAFIKEHPKLPISYIFQKNAGVAAARNVGIARAKGEWILALDSDDALLDNAIEILAGEAERAKADLVAGRTWRVELDTGKIKGIGGSTPSSALLKKTVFAEYGSYDEDRSIIEDVDHVYRLEPIIGQGKLVYSRMSYPTSVYFSHAGQVTNLSTAVKLVVKAQAMIKKWEPMMPHDAVGQANMSRLWRNKGVYQVLAGDRAGGLESIGHAFRLRSSLGTAVLYVCAACGPSFFRHTVLPLRHFSETLSFKTQCVGFFVSNFSEARELAAEVKRVVSEVKNTS